MRKPGRPPKAERVPPSTGLATRVPVDVHLELKARAIKCSKQLSAYLRDMLREDHPELPWGDSK